MRFRSNRLVLAPYHHLSFRPIQNPATPTTIPAATQGSATAHHPKIYPLRAYIAALFVLWAAAEFRSIPAFVELPKAQLSQE